MEEQLAFSINYTVSDVLEESLKEDLATKTSSSILEAIAEKDYSSKDAASDNTVLSDPDNKVYLGTFKVTAYCDCVICQGSWVGNTAMGFPPTVGVTVAVDTDVIALGTTIYLDGLGLRVAQDTGGGVGGNTIDVFMDTHEEALAWGIRYVDVYIIE